MISDEIGELGSQIKAARLPPLGALRCFEAAARLESFSRAADSLHLTHGAVSRAVRSLEEDLGVALFERRARRVFLTDAGRHLQAATAEAFALIAAAATQLRRQGQPQPLRLSCEPTLLIRWLIPRFPGFAAAHPGLAVQLVAGGGPVGFAEGLDLALRRNDHGPLPGTVSHFLFDETIGPVCAPARQAEFFAADGTPKPTAPLLHTATRPDAWATWAQRQGAAIPTGSTQVFEHFYLSLQAAVAGLGIAIGPQRLVADDLASGLLVAPAGFIPDGSHYHLLSPRPITPTAPEAAVLAWLRDLV